MSENITPGDRVALAPVTDAYMRGDRYGTVRSVYADRVILTTDGGRRLGIFPEYLSKVPLYIGKG